MGCAVFSCHVEQPLDDRCWSLFSRLQARRPGGFRIAALLRPPDIAAGEDEERWLERARGAAEHGPLGHHTHFVGPRHARPPSRGPEHADRVRAEGEWLRSHGLDVELFCGGGWYMDEGVARVLAELGYADCTATSFQPSYLARGAPRLSLIEPAWLRLAGGTRLLALPSTHSLGMAARAALSPRRLPRLVHVYFHDTDLLSFSRRRTLDATLLALSRRATPIDLGRLAAEVADGAPEVAFSDAASGP
jgi:hypothetical protein